MSKKPRKAYSKELKLEALQLLESSGKSAAELERELGIGKSNLSRRRRELLEAEEQAFPGKDKATPEHRKSGKVDLRQNYFLGTIR